MERDRAVVAKQAAPQVERLERARAIDLRPQRGELQREIVVLQIQLGLGHAVPAAAEKAWPWQLARAL